MEFHRVWPSSVQSQLKQTEVENQETNTIPEKSAEIRSRMITVGCNMLMKIPYYPYSAAKCCQLHAYYIQQILACENDICCVPPLKPNAWHSTAGSVPVTTMREVQAHDAVMHVAERGENLEVGR